MPAITGGLRREDDRAQLHNGMAISANAEAFFLSHSNEGVIYKFDFDVTGAGLSARTEFARVPTDVGLPDGAAVDTDGCYWCALHGAGRLRRYTPKGRLDQEVELPVSKPTMCAFGGDDLDTIYVTSASEGVNIADEPFAGALLRFRPGAKGIARSCTVRADRRMFRYAR